MLGIWAGVALGHQGIAGATSRQRCGRLDFGPAVPSFCETLRRGTRAQASVAMPRFGYGDVGGCPESLVTHRPDGKAAL